MDILIIVYIITFLKLHKNKNPCRIVIMYAK